MADAILEGRQQFDASRKEATPEDMGYAPSTTPDQYEGGLGVPRAKRTPRVYEPEEDEDLPVGAQRYDENAEETETEGKKEGE
jgi:sortase (surface protein transpeptidase)